MQYSNVNGLKTLPFPKGSGKCGICGAPTTAKCGEKVIWHWAHKSRKDCDPWWENETAWHRNWKEKFPESFREIVHTCEQTGEKHRADIKTDKGIILEIQNSPISLEELRSREAFYKNLVWIINGEKFQSRFHVFTKNFLPNPEAKEFDDIVFVPTANIHSCTMFWRKSENPKAVTSPESELVRLHSTKHLKIATNNYYVGHHPYYWQRPHIAWLEAKCPVFIDFGSDILWRLEVYKNQFRCVRAIAKSKIIDDIINKDDASSIAGKYSILQD